MNCNSLFMHGTMISDLLDISGDVHHIFPKAYLIENGIDTKGRYNQVANFTMLDTQVNKAISDDAPADYFKRVLVQCETKTKDIGNITDQTLLMENLAQNAIPEEIMNMRSDSYNQFLIKRRKLMAEMIENYYKSL